MDSKNANRITTVIGTLNSVTTKDADTARWIIDIIDQLEEIVAINTPPTPVLLVLGMFLPRGELTHQQCYPSPILKADYLCP